ncbi:hypothetical protein GCM10027515_29260 [Schumannella luteola]|uniref:Pilus assembly protein CpaE n=1 Tax=Schumannella luteola TaxID=472059 RepID=A0A852YDB4_9MICO|nr:pilus assembly protein CpaE [Schumannella luteola]NYG99274.1 hypothetical protein [Schumannella luteola]TPX02118.1 pilus assembly protein CpaE [Schumannella luteola]
MISTRLAGELRDAGLRWDPISGDAFQIAGGEFEGDVFTVSDMTIEPHRYDTGTVLGFNGTTEWALDSVALEDALWLPREDQLRELLRGAFLALERRVAPMNVADGVADGVAATEYRVTIELAGARRDFVAQDAAEAYGRALLALIRAAG